MLEILIAFVTGILAALGGGAVLRRYRTGKTPPAEVVERGGRRTRRPGGEDRREDPDDSRIAGP